MFFYVSNIITFCDARIYKHLRWFSSERQMTEINKKTSAKSTSRKFVYRYFYFKKNQLKLIIWSNSIFLWLNLEF